MSDYDAAFPTYHEDEGFRWVEAGMSLRDYFAGQAITGMLAAGITVDVDGEHIGEQRARVAYAIADAMLAVRDEQVARDEQAAATYATERER